MAEFIAIYSNDIGGDSPSQTKKVFDKEFIINDISEWKNIYDYSLRPNEKQVFISKNKNIAIPLISGINERFMIQENDNFTSKLKIIYFSNYHDLDNMQEKVTNSILSQLCGWTKCIFDDHKLTIKPDQIILVGLNDEDYDLDLEEINNRNIEYYTLSTIKKKGFETIFNKILEENKDCKILSYFNLEVFNKKICPSVERRNLAIEDEITLDNNINNNKMYNGIDYESLEKISKILQNKVDYLIITGFNSNIDNESKFWSRLTSEVVQILYRNIMNIKEKKINLFNENSRFLIFRELKQKSEEDIGWYILRLVSMEDRMKILEAIEDDKIYTINLNDFGIEKSIDSNDSDEFDDLENEILVTATTIDDQNKKTYFLSKSIMDCALFPQEKFLMGFEIVNL
jgi:hypothetical protein